MVDCYVEQQILSEWRVSCYIKLSADRVIQEYKALKVIEKISLPPAKSNFYHAFLLMPILVLLASLVFEQPAVAASKIKVLVNGEPITSYDIAKRAAFLKLRRIGGNRTARATEELIDEAVKMQAAKRVNIRVSNQQINATFARFAKSNKMSPSQLGQVLDRAGVTTRGFKQFIRAEMTWPRLLAAKLRAESSKASTDNAVFTQIHNQGGKKPSTTEYSLQQVIFVVPKAKRKAMMARRRREAKAFRNRFESCEKNRPVRQGS